MPRNASTAVLRNIRKLAAAPGDARQTDRDLLHRFAERHDEAAFEALVARHGSMVLCVCRRVLHTAHDAEDAWQATFLILARKAGTQRWQESVANWLYQTAYQTALRARTAARRRAQHEKQAPAREAVHPLAEMTGQEVLAALDEELLKLPERDRAPLVLCYLEGLTRDEAARHLGCPLGTLKSRLERGRDRLHTALVRRGLGLSAGLAAVALTPGASRALVPAVLLGPTVQAAQLLAAGKPAAEVLAAPVRQLLKGELGPMMLTKTKALLAALLAAGVLSGAGVLTYRAPVDRSAGEPSQVSARPVAAADLLPHQDEAQADPLLATDHLPEQDEGQAAALPAPPGQDVPGAKPVESLPETVSLGGRVLDRDDKPIARARMRVFASPAESRRVARGLPALPASPRVTPAAPAAVGKLLAEADAGSDGRFKLLVPRQALEDGVKVVATAPGRGPDWIDLSAADARDVTLRYTPRRCTPGRTCA
jgi:RNA polymerase sigma factor (sigma-70 family)